MSSLDTLPGAVLFACNFNKVRSPMAEALLKRAYGTAIFVDSCGLKADPSDPGMDPFAAAVLEELGIETAGHRPTRRWHASMTNAIAAAVIVAESMRPLSIDVPKMLNHPAYAYAMNGIWG